ncbi:hypothetical protein PISMIDRAFT_107192, partial [Pisolithus microcarpus 441]
ALFDDGAMVNAMCTTVFEAVKHRLRGWTHTSQMLRMANGSIIPAIAQWTGTIRIRAVNAQTTFIVFNSGGGWAFLAGKPMLQALRAVHDYSMDQLTITDGKNVMVLDNKYFDPAHKRIMGDECRTLDVKQTRASEAYAIAQPADDTFTRQTEPFNPR